MFERHLVDGINSKILVPFHYYGISDTTVDYQDLPWRNGRFDPHALDNAFATKKRAQHIQQNWLQYKQSRTLGFCASKSHADYMANWFNQAGVKAAAVYSGSQLHRNEALTQLQSGALEVLFSVDLFNEGTDIPAVDTVLILRPTGSKILFLQQLGRGLRQSSATGKSHLIVIDFIGNHKSFLNRPLALIGEKPSKKTIKSINDSPELADGCHLNIDPEITDFWQKLVIAHKTASEAYLDLADNLGRRPTASEYFYDGMNLTKMRKQHGSWLALVAEHSATKAEQQIIQRYGLFFKRAVEMTSMSRCFKAILLEAFLELGGLQTPPSTKQLAEQSWRVFQRYPLLWQQDVKPDLQHCAACDPKWLAYWLQNPIKFFCKQDKNDPQAWFKLNAAKQFSINSQIEPADLPLVQELMQELVSLRLAEYTQRLNAKPNSKPQNLETSKEVSKENNITQLAAKQEQETDTLPYYPKLKIACGHFKTGTTDEAKLMPMPMGYGKLDPSRHFLARASGNSMNGGKHPIMDSDLLLLEFIDANHAGSISNQIVAIEQLDASEDQQYLLRTVKKLGQGRYQLIANNPDYQPIAATEEMMTFARLKGVLAGD